MKCVDCSDYDEKEDKCMADYQEVTEEELIGIANEANMSYEELVRLIDDNEEHEIDLTGHEYIGCRYEGGCVICYPCNHALCWVES